MNNLHSKKKKSLDVCMCGPYGLIISVLISIQNRVMAFPYRVCVDASLYLLQLVPSITKSAFLWEAPCPGPSKGQAMVSKPL